MAAKCKKKITWATADEILRVQDVADLLDLGRNQTYELCRRQDFPSIRFGRQYRVSKTELWKWIEKKAQNN